MERRIEKKDNFFAIELREGEEVHIKTGDDENVFIAPMDCFMNVYLKRETRKIDWR